MRTEFSPEQLSDPAIAKSESQIRKCVHCGFCTATCPTYALLGDELDSPRGRIYLIKNMLEEGRPPTKQDVKHIDRCLSCLSCMTTCPSDVNYMHLVDHARTYIEENYRRPFLERFYRNLLAFVLPHQGRFRGAMTLGRTFKFLYRPFSKISALKPAAAMLSLIPSKMASKSTLESVFIDGARGRVSLLKGCAEPVLKPEVREATLRVLGRLGFDVIATSGEGCCGALTFHMGKEAESLESARRNIVAWEAEIESGGLDAILVTASGCGLTIKEYGHMLADDPVYAKRAARISELVKDISEFLSEQDMPQIQTEKDLIVAYHPPCSLQHGQKIKQTPQDLLKAAGFTVRVPKDAHLCCGSAGTYNILQPDIAQQLGDIKVENIDRLKADVIATGNIGCSMQIGMRTPTPVVHTLELLDWAMGGPRPQSLKNID